MSEKKRFTERFDREFDEGLKDVKFFVRDGQAMTFDDFFAEANKFHAAAANATILSLDELDARLRG